MINNIINKITNNLRFENKQLNNREKMKIIDIKNIKNTHGKEIEDFFYKINKKNQELTLIKDI